MLPKKRLVTAPSNRVARKKAAVTTVSRSSKVPAKPLKRVRALNKSSSKVTVQAGTRVLPTKRTSRTKRVSLVSNTETTETVTMLEGVVSKRLLAKRQAYAEWFNKQSVRDIGRVATGFGYLFVVIGCFLSVYIFKPDLFKMQNQSAALPCLDASVCTSATSTPARPTVTYVTNPEVIPGKDLVVTIQITDLQTPTLVVSSNAVPPQIIEPTSSDSEVYTFVVPTATFDSGIYRLRVEGETVSQIRTSFVGPMIKVGTTPSETLNSTAENKDTDPASSTEQVTLIDWETEPYQVSLIAVKDGVSLVEFTSTYRFERVEMYMRPDHSVQEFFVGQAEYQGEHWVYTLNNFSLPHGSYTLSAKGVDQGEVKGEAMISFKNFSVRNEEVATAATITPQTITDESTDDPSELLRALSIENHAGTTSELDQTESTSSVDEVPNADGETTGTQLSEAISSIIQVFAAAKQTNNPLLLRASESALAKAIAEEVRKKTDTLDFDPAEVATFENELRDQVKKEQSVVVIHTQNSTEFYPADSDRDGIPDLEEVAAATNPTQPDTDYDGILDGIEKVFGYNPSSPNPEAVLRLESPLEVPIIETLLGIETVAPYAFYSTDSKSPYIYQEISGFGIPNSFALLRINDAEVVSLVPVTADGTFTYTLEYELANGEHAVSLQYIANSGIPVAASRMFTFVKDDTSTNYIKTATVAPVAAATLVSETATNLPAAVGVVAFGLLLLYIGRGLRSVQLINQKQLG